MKNEPFLKKDVSIFSIPEWEKRNPILIVGFTTKRGGFSKGPYHSLNVGLHVKDDHETVVQNRREIARKLNFPLSNWVFADQVHDCHIEKVTSEHKGAGTIHYDDAIKKTDGLYTNEQNLLLSLCFADCVPLYFFAPKHHMIGLAHAGWRGTVKNIAGEMLQVWIKKEKVLPKDIYVAIGPSIGPCCYKVDRKVIAEVEKLFGFDAGLFYEEVEEGQFLLNLLEMNKAICLNEGIPEKNILTSSYCTSCQENDFFSHRRDQGKTGRMMSFIGFKEGFSFCR
ncbi:peptidoglycan editing factor PgeF [Bacillus alveayuensis]|jgi:polyphenol oxidase|uniref:peptidoglycan editing factor PgeF n=1 Tax=Aeribacillus alveayuensis TaxID=279215 RepID=UPI0005D13099|nr:peptidoglycan editing factor PgeF [Bacillus alveayuensis]